LKALKDSGDFALLGSVKQIILVCTRRNQAGDPNFTPLADTTSRLLQYVVGEAQWQRAERLLVMKIAVVVQEQERGERRKFNEFNEAAQTFMANLSLVQQRTPLVGASACALLFPGQSAPSSSILGATNLRGRHNNVLLEILRSSKRTSPDHGAPSSSHSC
jgi:signal transduction histidine kinase